MLVSDKRVMNKKYDSSDLIYKNFNFSNFYTSDEELNELFDERRKNKLLQTIQFPK